MLEDALDTVKTARGQLGTYSHMSEDLDRSMDGLRSMVLKIEDFLSSPARRALLTAAFILLVAVLNSIRARFGACPTD